MKKGNCRELASTILLIAAMIFSFTVSAQAQLLTYTDETTYLNALTTNGYSSFQENFEGAGWDPLVSVPQASFTERGITWSSRKQIKINDLAGRLGADPAETNAMVSYDPANLLDHIVPDILRGQYQSSSLLLRGVGGWFNAIPGGSAGNPRKIIFLLDDQEPNIYEDGEDTDGWGWDGPVASTATIASVSDTKRNSNAIEIGGGTFSFGTDPKDPASDLFTLTGGAPNTSQFIAEWSVRYVAEFAVYIEVSTSAGRRYLMYVPQGPEDPEVAGETVKDSLGLDPGELSENQRKWHIFVRDLQADLDGAQAPPGQPGWVGGQISQVVAFHLQGNVRVDDIEFHKISSGEFQITTGGYKFFGVIDTNGFKSFEILEPEGSPGDQEIIFNADDFTFGTSAQPPNANDDNYTVDQGGTLTVVAPGVLGNDSGTGIEAILVAGPAHHNGTFDLNRDGSFTYAHDGTNTTSDSFTYKVTDGAVDSNTARVAITINAINSAPVADAGPDQTVFVDDTVLLDGSGSSDADGDPLTYAWSLTTIPAASAAVLSDPTAVMPTFVADVSGTYVAQLIVNDGSVDSGSNTVTITASAATNQPPDQPNLNSPGNGQPNVPLAPELATFAFSDPDGDTHIQTQWQVGTVSNFSSLIFDTTTDSHLTLLRIPEGVLDEDSVYYWRARFHDNRGGVSEWAVPFSFTTEPTITDSNANGIPDDQEVDDTVDLDGDGTPDNFQNDIKSLNAATGTGQIGIKASTNVASIETVESINPDDPALADQYDPANKPGETPVGLLSFKLQVFNVGGTAEAMVYFSPPLDSVTKWYKYDSLNGWQDYSAHATFSADGTWVRLQFQDGGFGDADGIDNGKICDPSGAVSSASSAAPSGGGGGGGGGCFITTAAFCSATLPGFTWLALHVRPYFALVPLFLLLLWMSIPLSIRLKRRRMRNIFR